MKEKCAKVSWQSSDAAASARGKKRAMRKSARTSSFSSIPIIECSPIYVDGKSTRWCSTWDGFSDRASSEFFTFRSALPCILVNLKGKKKRKFVLNSATNQFASEALFSSINWVINYRRSEQQSLPSDLIKANHNWSSVSTTFPLSMLNLIVESRSLAFGSLWLIMEAASKANMLNMPNKFLSKTSEMCCWRTLSYPIGDS